MSTLIKPTQKRWLALAAAVLVIALLVGACALYVGDYYRADTTAIGSFLPEGSSWREEPDGRIVFEPENATAGFIFYPGGKVEHTAYIPLMQACAEQGALCILLEMPLRLAVLDANAARGIKEEYPEIEHWYVGGHSLGGSMAASYLSKNADGYDGLILLGSYATADLSASGLRVLSVFGSEDTVMNREKYDKYKINLPTDFTEAVLDGGCHAYFGMYGAQEGDGTPTLSNEEQITLTANAIMGFIKEKD